MLVGELQLTSLDFADAVRDDRHIPDSGQNVGCPPNGSYDDPTLERRSSRMIQSPRG